MDSEESLMPNFDFHQPFPICPRPDPKESIRSLLHRLAISNRIPLPLLRGLGQLERSTQFGYDLSRAAQWDLSEIKERGAMNLASDPLCGFVRVGQALLGKRCFVDAQRRICPLCILNNEGTPIDWELRLNQACHIHKCKLITNCPDCWSNIAWLSHDYACVKCDKPWYFIKTYPASEEDLIFSKWVNNSIENELSKFQRYESPNHEGISIGLEKLLLLTEVLRYSILKNWLTNSLWFSFNIAWSIELLNDASFRDWLWDAIYIYAAKNHLTVSQMRHPSGTAITTRANFAEFSSTLPVHEFVINSLQKLCSKDSIEKICAEDSLQRMSSRPVFNPHVHKSHENQKYYESYLTPC